MKSINAIYFGGGAFGCTYHIGVLSAIEHTHTITMIYGCSIGAMIGLWHIIGLSTADILNTYRNFQIGEYDTMCMSHLSQLNNDYPNAFAICNERLYIGTVSANDGFIWISKFSSNRDLFHAILCSCNFPLLSHYNSKMNGSCCIDGGFGFDLVYLPDETISVSLFNIVGFALRADMNVFDMIFPQNENTIQKYVGAGKADMEYYIANGHFPQYNSTNKPASSVIWTSNAQMIIRLLQEKMGGNTRELFL
jgi:hypothetical protein